MDNGNGNFVEIDDSVRNQILKQMVEVKELNYSLINKGVNPAEWKPIVKEEIEKEVIDQLPIFKFGELLEIRGCLFTVMKIKGNRLELRLLPRNKKDELGEVENKIYTLEEIK